MKFISSDLVLTRYVLNVITSQEIFFCIRITCTNKEFSPNKESKNKSENKSFTRLFFMLSDFYSKLFISNSTYERLLKQNFILLVVMQYKLNLPNILTLESNFTRSAIWFHHTTCVYVVEQIDGATRLKLI